MNRDRALKIVLSLVGLFFSAAAYPAVMILWQHDHSSGGDAMMLSLYFALGIFLLIAVRNPSAHRSLIAFAAWSSFAHAVVMTILALEASGDREALAGSAVLVVVGVLLLALFPSKQPVPSASPAHA